MAEAQRSWSRNVVAAGFIGALILAAWLYFDSISDRAQAHAFLRRTMSTNVLAAVRFERDIQPLGPELAVPALIEILRDESSLFAGWQEAAAVRVSKWLKTKPPDTARRQRTVQNSIQALAQFGPAAGEAVPILARVYERGGSMLGLRDRIATALPAFGPAATNAVPALVAGLHLTNSARVVSAAALTRIDPTGDLTARAMTELQQRVAWTGFSQSIASNEVSNLRFTSRWSALEILGCLRLEAPQTVPAIAQLCADRNERYRAKAAETLGRIGPDARTATKELRALLNDEWRMVREAASNALRLVERNVP